MKSLFIVIFIFIVNSCLGQNFSYKQFTTADGLPSNVVYRVFQDKKGYIWFFTNAGVSRFNGITFQNFTVKDGLTDNEVFGAFETSSGKMWFRTFNGKPCYYENGIFHNEKTDDWLRAYFPTLRWVYVDENNLCWATDVDNFVYVLNEKQRNIKKYPMSFEDSAIITTEYGADTIALNEHEIIEKKLSEYRQKIAVMADLDLSKYYVAVRKYLHFLQQQHRSVPLRAIYGRFLLGQPAVKSGLNDLVLTSNNGTWLTTRSKGIISVKDLSDLDEKPLIYLPDKNISYVLPDREGNLWFSSAGEGVFFLNAQAIKTFDFGAEKEVYSVTGDKNYIFCGKNNEVVVINKKNNLQIVWQYNLMKAQPVYNRVKDMLPQAPGHLWIAADLGPLCLHVKDKSRHVINPLPPHPRTVPIGAMKCIAKGSSNDIYMGSNGNLHKIDLKHIAKRIIYKRITAVAETADGNLLVGSTDGLHTYQDQKLSLYKTSHGLINQSITDIEKGNRDDVYTATSDAGLIILRNDSSYSISSADSLPANKKLLSDICRKIFIDSSQNIWISTNKGLCKLTIQSWTPFLYHVQHYTTDDGLISNDVNDVYVGNDTVWVATTGGLSFFKQDQIKQKGNLPLVYISNLDSVNKRSFSFKSKIAIGLEAISFESLGKVLYRYKLTGLDKEWQTTDRHELFYEVLPAGDYKLEVYAINRFGQQSAQPAVVSFSVLTPWWQTGWAYLLYIVGFVILSTVTIFFVKRSSRNKERARMKHIQQLQQLELKALRSQMNPHFIFNTLNAVQKYILENDVDSSYRYLTRFSKLIRSFLENSRHTSITLQQELDLLQTYMEMEALRFRNKFAYQLEVDPLLNPSSILIPSMLIQPYVENAIWHGILHKESNGKVKVSVQHISDNLLKCLIEDNGIGRRKAKEIQMQRKSQHQSVGMTITQQRLELINQRLKDGVHVNFIDITDQFSNEECGTIVELMITYTTR